jgi:hypothetical protein
MLTRSLAAVFELLAAPLRLGDWLPELIAVEAAAGEAGAGEAGEAGTVFGLRLRLDGREVPGSGEVIAYEPPWCVAYRLVAGSRTYVVRLTCVNVDGATRVSVHQASSTPPLSVDFSLLAGPEPETSG